MRRFAEGAMPGCRCPIRHFSGQGGSGFIELGHFDEHFVKNTRKRGPAGKHFGSFSPRYP